MNTSEVLNRAADLIQERGWEQICGWVDDGVTGLCLEGGIQAATGLPLTGFNKVTRRTTRPLNECPAYRAVADYLDFTEPLYAWNDASTRTASEVIEVLRACAVIEASREREAAEVSPESVSA